MRAVRFFTEETGIMDTLSVTAGRGDETVFAEDGRGAGERTLYDLASVTKLFTGICLLRLWEEGCLDPGARAAAADPRFEKLKTVTVEQLAGFQVIVKTPGRIDILPDRESALEYLFGSEVSGDEITGETHYTPGHRIQRVYSDIPAMILKYIIEKAAGKPFYDCVEEMILRPAGMRETWAGIPEDRISDCLLYSPEYRIEKEKWICRENPRGMPHDPKAALLQGKSGDLCGHAGLFSTRGDMERFCRGILEGKILRPGSLKKLAVNRTGRRYPDGSYGQYLGYLCYVKHPDQYFSEIPFSMSRESFGIGGFTGNHVSVDPAQKRFTVFLGNRVRDRLTVLVPEAGKSFSDYGLNPDGTGSILWKDGSRHFSSVNYVHHKDARLHSVIDGILL